MINPVPDAAFFAESPFPFMMYTGIVAGLASATIWVVVRTFLLGSALSMEKPGFPFSPDSLGSSDSEGSLSSGVLSSGSVSTVVSFAGTVMSLSFLLRFTT